ncbi:type VII secretion system-associated protein [Streptomyces sp. NPDC093249]|uniref:type VII secretion system-associated protein n=1 Tax=unclassified Streptomyces TaxID=2593676 RepID=UPI003450FAC9
MTDGKPPTQLDKAWIQRFKDDDIGTFRKLLTAVTTDSTDPVVLSTSTLNGGKGVLEGHRVGELLPLAIGALATDAVTNGQHVNDSVKTMVATLDAILLKHVELFKDIDSALKETIESLFETQGKTLDVIEGQKLYDIFDDEDVETDLTSPPDVKGGGSGGTDKK